MTHEYYDMLSRHRDSEQTAFVEDAGGDAIRYHDLFNAADGLAVQLNALLGEGNVAVGVYLPKSIAAVVSIFGVLAAHKAFVPIDPKTPWPRVDRIVESTRLRLVLVAPDIDEDALEWFGCRGVTTLAVHRSPGGVSCTLLGEGLGCDRFDDTPLADVPISHVLFTSGTTGTPKGVMIKVESQVAFTRCMARAFGHDPSTRWLSVSPLYFDVCTLDLLVEAHCGSTVVLMTPNAPPPEIVRALQQHRITHALLISSVLKMLASPLSGLERADLSALRALWYGGEACPVEALRTVKRVLPQLGFAQCYGPTEVCNNSTLYRFDDVPEDATGYMPLGRPLETVQAYVVGDDGRLVGPGGTGELFLGGVQVMAGYVADPEGSAARLTANRFDPDSPYPLYRTGDFVRLDEQGLLHFHGRKDDLVKLRGNRITLHEVQAAITSVPSVVDAIVYVGHDDIGGVLDSLNAIVVTSGPATQAGLRAALRARLPGYMVPDRLFIERDGTVPTKENGKLDRDALLRRHAADAGGAAGTSRATEAQPAH